MCTANVLSVFLYDCIYCFYIFQLTGQVLYSVEVNVTTSIHKPHVENISLKSFQQLSYTQAGVEVILLN